MLAAPGIIVQDCLLDKTSGTPLQRFLHIGSSVVKILFSGNPLGSHLVQGLLKTTIQMQKRYDGLINQADRSHSGTYENVVLLNMACFEK
jgi:hypothetical protein